MDSTVIVAAMGFAAALLTAWLTAHLQRQSDRDGRILEARLRVYGECSDSLFEYSRATYNRAKLLLATPTEENDEILRQEAYRCNARARSAIGQAQILTGDRALARGLSEIRHDIGAYNDVQNYEELRHLQDAIYHRLNQALDGVRSQLVK